MENTKCLVCGNDHEDGGNLPCTDIEGQKLYQLPDDINTPDEFVKWIRGFDKAIEILNKEK